MTILKGMQRFRRSRPRFPSAALVLLGGAVLTSVLWVAAGRAGQDSSRAGSAGPSPAHAAGTAASSEPVPADPGDLLSTYLALAEEGAFAPPEQAPAPPESEARAAEVPSGRFAMPLRAWSAITDRYGAPRGKGLVHGGIDLSLETRPGSPVLAACEGTVAFTGYSGSYGNHVIVDCGDGWSTLYGHLSSIRVKAGYAVTFDTGLGISGSTGYSTGEHLHFEIRWEGTPVNPEDYLDFHIPLGTPLSNGPIWFPWMDPPVRVRATATPVVRAAGAQSPGAPEPGTRPEATPTTARPTATPTPVPPTPTPPRATTPTPAPRTAPPTRAAR